jgi:NhaC family Na+:H+ antiporter
MMWTISLIMFALAYGGILEKCGFVEVLLGGVVRRTKSIAGLVAAEMLIGIACDIVLTDQYLAILVPGRMFQKAFDEKGLSRSFLSRTTEDAATLWSPMIPWNGCGAYQSATLGVANFAFAPFAFMNLINPIFALITVKLGINILYADGSRRNIFGKMVKKAPAAAPAEAHEKALAALEAIRAAK